jgi:uncharacterized protein (DUF1800 family)
VRQGLDASVDELLSAKPAPPTPIEDAIRTEDDRAVLAGAVLHRLVTSGSPLRENLALFFHNHFVSAFSKVRDAGMMLDQLALFRERGLGPFGVLVKAVTRDAAMVRYLDLERSNRAQPNENFARELMELFTTGPGPYGEGDVKEAARAFTGHHLRNGRFTFSEAAHDPGQKTVLGVAGRLGGDDVVDILVGNRSTPRFLAAKLARHFLRDEPSADDCAAIEKTWIDSGGDVREVLGALFRSDRFFAPAARHDLTRPPAALIAAAAKLLGSSLPPVKLAHHSFAMGQALLDPPTVKGYDGGRRWLNPATWLTRRTFLLEAVAEAKRRGSLPPELAQAASDPDAACAALLGAHIDGPARDALGSALALAAESGTGALEVLVCHPAFQRC